MARRLLGARPQSMGARHLDLLTATNVPRHTPAEGRGLTSLMRALSEVGPLETPHQIIKDLNRLIGLGVLDLPLPGRGQTMQRYRALAEVAAVDLSLARLVEGHTDAVAILAEADHPKKLGRSYGVWAADPPTACVTATQTLAGYRLNGRKRYASGARGLDRALVTAKAEDDGIRLFDVDLRQPNVKAIPNTWQAVGMAATESLEVAFDDVFVADGDVVSEPGFYLTRPGFWHGAVGVAACWYGGARGAFRMLRARLEDESAAAPSEHQLAHFGAIAAACETMEVVLANAAHEIDAAGGDDDADDDDDDAVHRNKRRALMVRHVVEQASQDVLTRVGRASGSSPLVFDRDHARRAADLVVYLRQHHAERDLVDFAREVLHSPEKWGDRTCAT